MRVENYVPVGMSSMNGSDAASMLRADSKKTDEMEAAVYAAQEGNDEELLEACRSFESYFLQMMFREMRKTTYTDPNGVFAKSSAELIFQDMMDEQVSINAAKGGGIGLAAFMYKQMKQTNPVVTFDEYNELQEQQIVDEQI